MSRIARLVFLASNNGSAMRAVARAIANNKLKARIELVISNKTHAPALTFARENNINAKHINDDKNLAEQIKAIKPDFIVLSGYLKKIPPSLLAADIAPVINIHPSLLPKFGGKGMFGINVHKAVLAAKEKYSGATIHYVNEHYDEGEIITQTRLAIKADDSPESLATRVMKAEEKLVLKGLEALIEKIAA